MKTAGYEQLGVIKKPQGLQGSVIASLRQEINSAIKVLFMPMHTTMVPYLVRYFSCKQQKAVIKFQGIVDQQAAYQLKGLPIFVSKAVFSALVKIQEPLANCIGYHVRDCQKGSLGEVQHIYTPPQQKLLAVNYLGQLLLIPYNDTIVTHIDHGQQTILVQLPKGFIEALLGTPMAD